MALHTNLSSCPCPPVTVILLHNGMSTGCIACCILPLAVTQKTVCLYHVLQAAACTGGGLPNSLHWKGCLLICIQTSSQSTLSIFCLFTSLICYVSTFPFKCLLFLCYLSIAYHYLNFFFLKFWFLWYTLRSQLPFLWLKKNQTPQWKVWYIGLTMPHVLCFHCCQDGMNNCTSSFANQLFLVVQNWDQNLVLLIVSSLFKNKVYKQTNLRITKCSMISAF